MEGQDDMDCLTEQDKMTILRGGIMFSNEVLVEKPDKERLVELLREANTILDKYPYEIFDGSHTVTTMSRAKSFTKDAEKWCGYLHIKE